MCEVWQLVLMYSANYNFSDLVTKLYLIVISLYFAFYREKETGRFTCLIIILLLCISLPHLFVKVEQSTDSNYSCHIAIKSPLN